MSNIQKLNLYDYEIDNVNMLLIIVFKSGIIEQEDFWLVLTLKSALH